MNLKLSIKELQTTIRKQISGLNSGGCAIFAYYFSKRLRELNIPHSIVFLNCDPFDKSFFTYKNMYEIDHVAIIIPGIGIFDGYGFDKGLYYHRKSISHKRISLKKLEFYSLKGHFVWSSLYSRSQNSKLSKLIASFNA